MLAVCRVWLVACRGFVPVGLDAPPAAAAVVCFVLSVLITFRCFPVRTCLLSGIVLLLTTSSWERFTWPVFGSLIVRFAGLDVRGTADFRCLRLAWLALGGGLVPAFDARFEWLTRIA